MKKLISWILVMVLMLGAVSACAQEQSTVSSQTLENDQYNLSCTEGLPSQWRNILLIGADSRQKTIESGRADAIIVCSIHRQTGQIKLTSLLRDLWVEMDDGHYRDRINTAFRYGGPELMMKTVNETLKLNITEYVAINFYGFCDVVDSIGGVEIELGPNEAAYINKGYSADFGDVTGKKIPADAKSAVLTGEQALGYARIRKIDSDMKRTERHRKLITAILNKVLTLGFEAQCQFVDQCLSCVATNISRAQILLIGMQILAHGMDDMEQIALPSAGNYYYVNHDGRSTYEFKKDVIVEEAHAFIYGTDEDAGNDAQ